MLRPYATVWRKGVPGPEGACAGGRPEGLIRGKSGWSGHGCVRTSCDQGPTPRAPSANHAQMTTGADLARQIRRQLIRAAAIANGLGGSAVFVVAALAPGAPDEGELGRLVA